MASARRRGRHLYLNDWRFHFEADPEHAVEAVLAWCRETLSRCPRPFGIDHFDFAFAVKGHDYQSRSLTYKKIRPAHLYSQAFARELAALLHPATAPERPAHGVY